MAKKETENLVEEKLKNLYQLQTTLSAIDEKRALVAYHSLNGVGFF